MKPKYEVLVGNLGTVYSGDSKRKATGAFRAYVSQSKSECGRAGGEEVTMFCDGGICREYRPTIKWRVSIADIASLLVALKKDIGDEYRCSDDPDDNTPGMLVTVSTTDGSTWSYQTGDNSYIGACYHDRHWSVIYLYRNSNCRDLARDAVNELRELVNS